MDGQKVITFPQLPQFRNFPDAVSFGEYLRSHRERRRITLAQVAGQTKFAVPRLEALERGDVDQLPKGIYRRGFVKAYAAAIGLDPAEVVEGFLKLFPAQEEPLPAPEQFNPHEARPRMPRAFGAIAAGLAAGALAVALQGWTTAPADPRPPADNRIAVAEPAPPPPVPVPTSGLQELPADDVSLVSNETTLASTVTNTVASTAPPSDPAPPAPADRTLRITSDPSGARVTVNGIGWGETPLAIPYLRQARRRSV